METGEQGASTLLRHVRLVPVRSPAASDQPLDVRIAGGMVVQVAPALESLPGELIIDGAGRHAIPGLWDQHVHLLQWAQSAVRLDLRGATSVADATRIVGEHLASLPAGEQGSAVFGFGHRPATWSRGPTVAELDAVTGRRPVVLVSGDVHNGWLNTEALRLLGLTGVTGPLEENDWFSVFARLDELPGPALDDDENLRRRTVQAAARGVVGVVDFEFGPGYLDWPDRMARGIDQLRVRTATYADRLGDVITAGLRSGDALPRSGGLAQMGPLKIIADGSLNTGSAYCCTPYLDAGDSATPRGQMNLPLDELDVLLRRARLHGLDVAVHAIGDAAVACALDAFEATGATGSVEHAQLVAASDVARMARLGITASVQPAHLLDDRDVAERSWQDRTGRCFALHSMLAAGVTVRLGSDAPVSPLDPWLAMAAAVHRSGDERPAWHPAEAISARAALAASTDGQDTIAPGSRGDIALLDQDPLQELADTAAAADHLRAMTVAATLVAGRVTHLDL